ncbi:alpha/beta hydrolase [Peribacillus simplex]|uniref:Carboxylesterase n=1 Tax=Peribacillus simplex TaxID=1478 RepID=A0A9X8REI4_9BACI|nr:alpha/beta fold hydrolase [Peribacillus simplex]WHY57012.1 alpha/beta fold hydrolase [Peribacillus simplex]SIS09122.1 carboxylesterase [Peribacillus simplex]
MTAAMVIPGAESFFLPGNSIGILICHGFNGTPQSVRYLGEKFAAKGFTVFAPRLAGHGTDEYEMETSHYQEWIQDVEMAYAKLKRTCTHVFAIGQSMGGALVLDLATKVACDGILTINAALQVPEYEKYRNQSVPRFVPEGKPDIKDDTTKEITYDQVPAKAINQLLDIMEHTSQKLVDVSCPILIFHSPEDHVVPDSCSYQIYDAVMSGDKEMAPLENSYHVASLDHDKDHIIDRSYQFIQRLSKRAIIAS